MKTKIEFYQDTAGDWRWRAKRAGRIVADSAEGYRRKAICRRSFDRLARSLALKHYAVTTC